VKFLQRWKRKVVKGGVIVSRRQTVVSDELGTRVFEEIVLETAP
jgi:hypothetical protein